MNKKYNLQWLDQENLWYLTIQEDERITFEGWYYTIDEALKDIKDMTVNK